MEDRAPIVFGAVKLWNMSKNINCVLPLKIATKQKELFDRQKVYAPATLVSLYF